MFALFHQQKPKAEYKQKEAGSQDYLVKNIYSIYIPKSARQHTKSINKTTNFSPSGCFREDTTGQADQVPGYL